MSEAATVNQTLGSATSHLPRLGSEKWTLPPFTASEQFQTSDLRSTIPMPSYQTFTFRVGTSVLSRPGLEFARDVAAEVEYTPNGVVIRSGEFDEESYGSSFREAYLDFLTSLPDRLASMEQRKLSLSDRDRQVLERLRALLRPGSESQQVAWRAGSG